MSRPESVDALTGEFQGGRYRRLDKIDAMTNQLCALFVDQKTRVFSTLTCSRATGNRRRRSCGNCERRFTTYEQG